jgi:uncharacterized protein (TIGR03435 family)
MLRIAIAAVLAAIGCEGQSTPVPAQFEVVSIKPSNAPDLRKSIRGMPGGGFQAVNYSLRDLIQLGWNVRSFQISGGPGWLGSARYDVETRTAIPFNVFEPDGQRQFQLMVQSLLADRFQLALHRDQKEMRVYLLVPAGNGVTPKRTGDAVDRETSMHDGKGFLAATKIDMPMLARDLSGEVGIPVLDRSNLSGVYDIRLEWNPDEDTSEPAADTKASIFTALQEQLGLKLETGRAPVDVLIVDHAEKASPN